jgi:hypothetical protein
LEERVLLSDSPWWVDCDCGVTSEPAVISAPTATANTHEASVPPPAVAPAVQSDEQLAAASSSDAYNTDPATWQWWHGVDAQFLTDRINEGFRIVDLEVETAFPLRFTAALVHNSGSYGKGWYWYYDQPFENIASLTNQLGTRVTDIEVYPIGTGQYRYALLMVPNTGAEAKAWWYYAGVTPGDISSLLAQNNARLVDVERYDFFGQSRFAVLMISNTGADARGWWYSYGATPGDIANAINANNARLVDIEPVDPGHFDIILEAGQSQRWYWTYAYNDQTTLDIALQYGVRPFHVVPYFEFGQKRFAALMIENSNALERRVGDIITAAISGGAGGAYLKRVGGPVIAAVNADKRFEPASAIKALPELQAMRAVRAGTSSLNDQIFMYYNPTNPFVSLSQLGNPDECPDQYAYTSNNRVSLSLQQLLELMMERSDNRATRAIAEYYGKPALNALADLIGMSNSDYTQTIGCGIPGNYLTLADIGRLYEGVANGTLLGTGQQRTDFWRFMIDETVTDLEAVAFGEGVDPNITADALEEAASLLGRPTSDALVQALTNAFLALVTDRRKGGSYDLGHPDPTKYKMARAIAGLMGLPARQGGNTVLREYVYGLFIDQAVVPQPNINAAPRDAVNDAVFGSGEKELFRPEIRSALATWSVNPDVSVNDVQVTEGNSGTVDATFAVSLSKISDLPFTVHWMTNDGSAGFADYAGDAGQLDFFPGELSKTVTIKVKGDALDEDDEKFTLTLTSSNFSTIIDGTGVANIIDNDPPPSISIAPDPIRAEGDSGTTAFTFEANLSAASAKPISVLASTANGTATLLDSDYQALTSMLVSFAPGQLTRQVTVLVNGDVKVEPSETFVLNLSGATNAAIADSQGVGTILNDDVAPRVSSASFLVDAPRMELRFGFDANVGASLGTADLSLRNLTTGVTVPTASLAVSYVAGNVGVFTMPGYTAGILPEGRYRATLLAAGITDPVGHGLDGDGNGQPGGDFMFDFFFINGDANRDGRVDFNDLVIVAQNYNKQGTRFSTADFTWDNKTDFNDLVILAQRYNTALPAAAVRAPAVFSDTPVAAINATLFNTPALRPVPKVKLLPRMSRPMAR